MWKTSGCIAVSACCLLGCHASNEEPASWPELYGLGRYRPESPRVPLDAATRATATRSFPFAYAGLPLAGEAPGDAPLAFKLDPRRLRGRLELDRSGVFELEMGRHRAYAAPESSAPFPVATYAARGTTTLDAVDRARHSLGCPRRGQLRGFEIADFTESKLRFTERDAVLDPKTCEGTAKAQTTVDAIALVPGILYAFRARRRAIPPAPPDEELVVIGPPARWVVSTALVDEQVFPHVGTFTMVRVPMRPGGAGSLTMHVDLGAVAYFEGLRIGTEPPGGLPDLVLSYTVDVTWPADGSEPNGLVLVAYVEDGAEGVPAPGEASVRALSPEDDLGHPRAQEIARRRRGRR